LRPQLFSILLVHQRRNAGSGSEIAHLETHLRRALSRVERDVNGSVELWPYAEDEFVVILRNAGKDMATDVAQVITQHLVAEGVGSEDCYDRTAGIGVASAPADGRTIEELVATARQQSRIVQPPSTTRQVLH
jgi:GGDEF domain-containing protein